MTFIEALKITKDAVNVINKGKNWKTLTRQTLSSTDEIIKTIQDYGHFQVPNKAKSIIYTSGEHINGKSANFFIFKDANGKNLGSSSLWSDGKRVEISIRDDLFYTEHLSDFAGKLVNMQGFKSKARIYNKQSLLPNGTSRIEKTFTETFPKPNSNDIYQGIIRTGAECQNGTKKLTQEIMQIEKEANVKRNFVKTELEMAQDGTVLNSSIKQSKGINIDVSNPYYNNALLDIDSMLKIEYARIAEERGFRGIAPDVSIDKFDIGNPNTRMDVAKIYMPVKRFLEGNVTRSQMTKHLGHECEHLFEQATSIQRAGIMDLVCPEYREYVTFYDDVISRFGKIQKGTDAYMKAERYANEVSHYNMIYDSQCQIHPEVHSGLNIEKLADEAGEKERNLFLKCLDNFRQNFSLFNRRYAEYHKEV